MTQILTFLGKTIDLRAPDAQQIDPRDIAHALGQICRFGGHTSKFYSVAQHSCIVADLVPEEHKLAALLHDATEAYCGDVVQPLKQVLPAYRDIEQRFWISICERFWIDPLLPECVLQADMIALATERRDLMQPTFDTWVCLDGVAPMAKSIRPWGVLEARETYFQRLMDQLAIEHRRKAGAVVAQAAHEKSPALLRNVLSVAAQKTKSLCCAAAGITEEVSATAEARIPHEKLRRAATSEDTLNARVCPPAQLAQGYKPLPKTAEGWALISPRHVGEYATAPEVTMLMEHAKCLIGTYHHALRDLVSILSSNNCSTGAPGHCHQTPGRWEFDDSVCLECATYDVIRELASGKKESGYA